MNGLIKTYVSMSSAVAIALHTEANALYIGNESVYLEDISPPTYDSGNSAHALVTNRTELNAVISDLTKTAVFLSAGDYDLSSSAKIKGGSIGSPRWFLLAGGGTAHPASLTDNEQANVKLSFDGDYIIAHRLSFLDYMIANDANGWGNLAGWETDYAPYSNIIIDSCHLREFQEGIYFRSGATDNTVQNCRFEMTWTDDTLGADRVATMLGGTADGQIMTGNKFLNNEYVNCVDAFQCLSAPTRTIDYGGTIVDYNTVWYDDRADTIDVNKNVENYFDFKDGGTIGNPIIVSNNVCWGLEVADRSDDNMVISLHYGAKYIEFENNLFTGEGIVSIADVNTSSNLAASYITFKDNVLLSYAGTAIVEFESDNLTFDGNIIKCETNRWYYVHGDGSYTSNQTIKNNLILNADQATDSIGSGTTINQDNSFYNVLNTDSIYVSGTNNSHYTTAAEANLLDYSIYYDVFSGNANIKTFTEVTITGKLR